MQNVAAGAALLRGSGEHVGCKHGRGLATAAQCRRTNTGNIKLNTQQIGFAQKKKHTADDELQTRPIVSSYKHLEHTCTFAIVDTRVGNTILLTDV